jgi:hypothetical protein
MKKIIAGLFTAVLVFVGALGEAEAAEYTYTSEKYGFSMDCPQKPVAVLDLAVTTDQKGVMMIFENNGLDITYDWVVLTEAFDDETFPDFSRIDQAQLDAFLKSLVEKDYGFAQIVPMEEKCPALYLLGIDEDNARTYFTGLNGERYGIVMHSAKDKFFERVEAYVDGLASFKSFAKK